MDTREKCLFRLAVGIAAVLASVGASATPALTSWKSGTPSAPFVDLLYGWSFSVGSTVNVSALGVWDQDGDGLTVAHDVGLYRMSDQSLLAWATVAAGTADPLDGQFRYATLTTGSSLEPGNYVIVMTAPGGGDASIAFARQPTTLPGIGYLASMESDGSVLAYPAISGASSVGLFGPNFEVSAVPEPATWSTLLAGGLVVGTLRRRQRKDAAPRAGLSSFEGAPV